MRKGRATALILAGSILLGSVTLTGCGGDEPELCLADTAQTESGSEQEHLETVSTEYDMEAYSACFWRFSQKLFEENSSESNPVLSPMSAYLAMGMITLGAKEETLEELVEVLGQGMDANAVQALSQVWMDHIPTVGNTKKLSDKGAEEGQLIVSLANSAWMDEELEPDNDWLAEAKERYAAEVFRGKLAEKSTMHAINDWVEKKTNALIQGFLDKPLPESCRLALFNTLYFHGTWEQEFKPESTRKREFYVENATCGIADLVDMMQDYHRTEFYVQNEVLDGVVMPYRDGNMALVALKPTAGQSVRQMYEALTYEELSKLLKEGEERLINLRIPKFEVEFDKKLNDSLQSMGIEKAFDAAEADFSGLGTTVSGNPLYIDLVQQKAVVKLNEKGTEAAAVTMAAVTEGAMEMQEQPIDVFFDRPFFYMIMDMEYKTPLFMGILDFPEP